MGLGRVETTDLTLIRAASYEHELGSEVPTRLPITNILLSFSRIREHSAPLREHFARVKGHHNGHHYREAAARKRSASRRGG
jgi:hypothetical protein